MMATDEDALYCDLAETYGIFNWEALPVERLATLAIGLPDDARIKLKIADAKLSAANTLLAGIMDRLSVLVWQNTKDGAKGRNKPKFVLEGLDKKAPEGDLYASGEDFMAARNRILERFNNGEQRNSDGVCSTDTDDQGP